MTSEQYQRVKEIFQAAVECEPGERAALLAESCNGDVELIHEVESLLEYQNRADKFIEKSAFEVGARLLTTDEADALEGKRIGQYKLIRRIGSGGMGLVYLAERADKQFQKNVAIKIVRVGLDSAETSRRFAYERQILAALDHPNIAKLLDAGTTDGALPYLVMDYVEGAPINRYCDEHKLSTSQRLKLFHTVCSAVQFAHQRLVIHRDIKPGNILVSDDGVPKLLDFGIAKLLDPSLADAAAHTQTGLRVMTPEYASPEQVRGLEVTTASDIYSLGVLLYELLTGERPYRITSRRPDEIARAICEQEPTKPSQAVSGKGQSAKRKELRAKSQERSEREQLATDDGQQTNLKSEIQNLKSLRGDLDNIVLKAMQKEPQRRYSSVEQFSEDISRHLEGLPVSARPDTFGYRSAKFIRRHKVGVTAAMLVGLSLIAGIVATAWQARAATAQRDRARAEAQKADELNRFLQRMLASADPSVQGKDVTVARLLGEAAKRVDTEFSNQPETTAAMRSTIGMTYLALGLYDAAEPQLRAALETRQRSFGVNHPDVATSMNNLAQLLVEQGKIAEAEQLYRKALDISTRLRGADDLETAAIMHNLAALLVLKGSLDEAEQMNRTELAIRRRKLGNKSEDVAKSLNDLGVVLGTKGDLAGAEQLHREALAITQQIYGPEHVNVAATLATVAAIVEERGDYVEAEKFYQQALAMRRKLLGPEHPTVTWTMYNYAYMLTRKGEYQKAEQLAREVLALRGKTLNDEHPMVASTLQVLAKSLMEQGDTRAAESFLRESLELRRKSLPTDHWLIGNSESILGECLIRLGRFREAEPFLREGYAKLKSKFGPDHSRTREAWQRLNRLNERAASTQKHVGANERTR